MTLCDAEKEFYKKRRGLIKNSMKELKVEGGVSIIFALSNYDTFTSLYIKACHLSTLYITGFKLFL